MERSLCLFHDHALGREPAYISDLSASCRVVEVHRHDWVRLTHYIDLPWLVDLRRIDGEAVALISPFFVFSGPIFRLVAVDRWDRQAAVQAAALGATSVVLRPIEAARVLGLIGGAGCRNDPAPEPEAATLISTSVEWQPPRRSLQTDWPLPSEVASIITVIKGVVTALDRLALTMIAGRSIVRDDWEGIVSDVIAALHIQRLGAWLDIVRYHHVGTYQHSLLVMAIAIGLARSLGLPRSDIERLALGGLLHDIGKFLVPEAILDKPGRLTSAEFAVMRRHPHDGWAALRSVEPPLDPGVLDLVLQHHEHLDGKGYPNGLSGAEIPPLTRMLVIADIYGALIEQRSYRPPLPKTGALAIIEAMAAEGKVDRDLMRPLADLDVGSVGVRRVDPSFRNQRR
ncbi:HD-GYP domain-containing protein [Labrys monachus]|uniref:Nucleotidyltransferase with HDIG domain n=1 Tax=Labrys monachus TaxID=217067 RepID=A0ABU0F710_9HYPH|nr:HD domain-containing phosphohydrolase [Labrys monachus]MDQ0390398.1 putative nucleotidyltransferase with HDIG domain [Labrys monachus]